MGKDTVIELRRPAQGQDLLSTMLREGAQRLVAEAVQIEFDEFLARFAGQRTDDAAIKHQTGPPLDQLAYTRFDNSSMLSALPYISISSQHSLLSLA